MKDSRGEPEHTEASTSGLPSAARGPAGASGLARGRLLPGGRLLTSSRLSALAVTALMLALAPASASATSSVAVGTTRPAPAVENSAPSTRAGEHVEEGPIGLDALNWLAGSWGDEGTLELWTNAEGGMMLGLHRDVSRGDAPGDRRASFEFLRIARSPSGDIVYYASPSGRSPATPFVATEIGNRRVVFSNEEHDFPKHITYWLDDEGVLHAAIEGDGGAGHRTWAWPAKTD